MFKRIIALILITFTLSACEKPDPNPELKDPIYNDLNVTLGTVSGLLTAEVKALEGFQKELGDVIPQTGQIRYAQKRVNESKEKITKLEQEKRFLEIKIEARKKEARKTYKIAFEKKEAWPDPQEWENYRIQRKFQQAKKTWDVKERIKELEGPKEPAPAAGGGH